MTVNEESPGTESELDAPFATVEASSFYHRLAELHTNANSREEAQVALAISALKRLSTSSNEGWSRGLLLEPANASKPNAYVKKERLAKDWFRAFLEMLIDSKAIDTKIQDSNVLYRASTDEQKNLLRTIINKAVYQDGLQVLRPEIYQMTQSNPFETDEYVASSEDTSQEARTLETFVRTRYAAADERDKARFIIAFTALDRLLHKSRMYDRKNLLATPAILAKVSKQIPKEVASKEWSRTLLDRWVARGLVSRQGSGASTYFRTTTDEQRNTIKDIIINCLYADGVELKKLIWPEDYASIDASDDDDVEVAEPQQAQGEAASEDADVALVVVQQVTAQLEQVALHMKDIYEGMMALEKRLDEKLTTLTSQTERVLGALEDEDRVQLKLISDRLLEANTRKTSLINQLNSSDTRDDKIRAEIEALSKKKGVSK